MVIGNIICESSDSIRDSKIISETPRRVLAECTLQTADELNRNRRIYEAKELFPQITCPRTVELINAGYMRAESGHPLSKDLNRQQTIDPTNTCALFKKMWIDGKNVKGIFCGTNNQLGEALDLDLRDGYMPAWSLRALGSLEQTKKGAVVRNLKLITYDHVIYPSHPHAYTTRIIESGNIQTSNINDNIPSNLRKLLKENNILNEDALPAHLSAEYSNIIPITNEKIISYIKQESMNFNMIKESFDILYDNISLLENGNVQMQDKSGNIIIVNTERYIKSEIMNHCFYRLK